VYSPAIPEFNWPGVLRRASFIQTVEYHRNEILAFGGGDATQVETDMTQAHAVSKLRQRKLDIRLMSAIIDEVPLPIFVKDANSVFVLSNRRHAELVGKSEGELIGQTTAVLHGPDEALKSKERDLPVLETGQQSIVQRDYAYANGNTCFLETRKTRLIDEHGQSYVLGVNIDLTSVRQNEEHLRALTEAVPVGIVEILETGEIATTNAIAVALLAIEKGKNGSTALKHKFEQLGPGFPGEMKSHRLNLESGPGFGQRDLVIKSSGWITLPHSKERMALVSIIDVSEIADLRRQNEQIISLNAELSAALRDLEQAQAELVKRGKLEQLGQLTATIAHELRNPLGSVRTSAFLLERKLGSDSQQFKTQLDRISNGVMRCDDIITQLLDFARSKTLILKSSAFDPWLSQLLLEIAKEFPPCLEIICELGLENAPVAFDEGRMRRAVVNTIQNAVEAMITKEGQRVAGVAAVRIEIVTRMEDANVVVDIRDTGPGIPADVLTRIREPLFTTKNFGTGLGVPAVERILEQHGGNLSITSELGVGTCITLKWPINPVVHGEEEAA
jgi:PAS domain S-box-containing protein